MSVVLYLLPKYMAYIYYKLCTFSFILPTFNILVINGWLKIYRIIWYLPSSVGI